MILLLSSVVLEILITLPLKKLTFDLLLSNDCEHEHTYISAQVHVKEEE